MPKVVITPRSYGIHSTSIREKWTEEGFEVVYQAGPHDEAALQDLLKDADALLLGTDLISEKILESCNRLKVISKYGVGIDNIPIQYAKQRGIQVFNTPGVNTEAVADYTFGLIISLARRIPQSHSDLRNGKWAKSVGVEIFGKTLGILGLGAIGKAVARRAKGFEMNILAYDLYHDEDFAQKYSITYTDMATVLRECDILSVHLALTPETHHLISKNQMETMKNGSMIINTARGGIVDEEALYEAIANRKLAGAALDVFQVEPPTQSPLCQLDHVILTPHNASASIEAIERMTEQSTNNIIHFFKEQQCLPKLN